MGRRCDGGMTGGGRRGRAGGGGGGRRGAPRRRRRGRGRDGRAEAAGGSARRGGGGGSEYPRHVVPPGVLRLLAAAKGEAVVDVACGQGALARLLHERGAEVTGVDAAAELIGAARERGLQA